MEQIYLSRRNLLTLLSKLDRKKNGEDTKCTITKQDWLHPKYPQSIKDVVMITAIEDEEYYYEREAGKVHPNDDPNLKKE